MILRGGAKRNDETCGKFDKRLCSTCASSSTRARRHGYLWTFNTGMSRSRTARFVSMRFETGDRVAPESGVR